MRTSIALIALVALVGCKKQPTEQPDSSDVAKAAESESETPEQGCKRMLERFGEDIVEVELDVCVTALTEGAEIGICREAGVTDDFMSCFDSCMGSVDLDPAEYSPGDSSTSPVSNCVGGCFQTSGCQ
jgi:predicted small lipoprotein YifL